MVLTNVGPSEAISVYMELYTTVFFRKYKLTKTHKLVAFGKGTKPLNEKCTQNQIKKLCQTYSKETGEAFKSYYDTKFLEWLEESNPTQKNERKKFYTFIDSSKFAQAIMDAYMTSMNEVSKKLDNQVSKETYSKQEVLEIVFEAFNSAKTIGEGQIQNSK